MADDVAKIKVGQKPSGTEIQKTIPVAPRPIAPVAPTSPSPVPVAPRPQATLGDAQKAPSLAPLSPLPRPIPAAKPVQTYEEASLPSSSQPTSRPRTGLYLLILLLVLIGAGVFFYFNGKEDELAVTPTPIATATPTPTPTPSIGSLIGGAQETITLSQGANPSADFLAKINALTLAPGELRTLIITGELKGSGEMGLTDILDRFLLTYPVAIRDYLGNESIILVFGQKEIFTSKGQFDLAAAPQERLVFLTEVQNVAALTQALSAWETTMADSLASVLGISKTKATGTGFVSSTHSGTPLRYRNYPNPDQSIDYALVPASNGKTYLLVAGSRESTLFTIDKLKR